MKNILVMYTPEQMEEIQSYIKENFGGDGDGVIAHEIESEYVHIDTEIIAPAGEERRFVTFGIGAGEMNSPLPDFTHTELVIHASSDFDHLSRDARIISAELCRAGRYPFRENTWFGEGHTFDASDKFKERFGFEYFAFHDTGLSVEVTDIGEVHFLALIPIYEDEREWIVENNTVVYLEQLFERFGEKAFDADSRREHFVPEEDAETLALMSVLGIDKATLDRLSIYLEERQRLGGVITYEDIERWINKNIQDK